MKLLLHLLTSLHGTTLTSCDVGYWSAFGGKADLSQTSLEDSV